MAKKSLDEQLKELENMLAKWYTKDREEELMRVQLQRKVKEIRESQRAYQDMIRCGKYRHFKGNEYVVMGVGVHTETEEKLVIYYACKDPDKVWVRPLSMWNEIVKRDGYEGPRFTWVGSD